MIFCAFRVMRPIGYEASVRSSAQFIELPSTWTELRERFRMTPVFFMSHRALPSLGLILWTEQYK